MNLPEGFKGGAFVLLQSPTQNELIQLGTLKNIDPKTALFPVYSVAKTVLAILALKLEEQGVLSLDDQFSTHTKRALPHWFNPTLTELLLHRSNLKDYGGMKEYHQAVKTHPKSPLDHEQLIQKVFDLGPVTAENNFYYSNVGYLFIKEVVESASGKSLQTLVDELRIEMTYLKGTFDSFMPNSSVYVGESSVSINSLYHFDWVLHGTFASTIYSMNKFISGLHKILKPSSLQKMIDLKAVEYAHPYTKANYGLGLMGDLNSSFGTIYGHTGGGPGFSVTAYYLPQKDLAISVVVNQDSVLDAEKLMYETLKLQG